MRRKIAEEVLPRLRQGHVGISREGRSRLSDEFVSSGTRVASKRSNSSQAKQVRVASCVRAKGTLCSMEKLKPLCYGGFTKAPATTRQAAQGLAPGRMEQKRTALGKPPARRRPRLLKNGRAWTHKTGWVARRWGAKGCGPIATPTQGQSLKAGSAPGQRPGRVPPFL